MRKLKSFLSILVVVLLAGCSTAKPESTVSAFIEAGKKFDLVKMAETVNPSKVSDKEKIESLTQEGNNPINQYQNYFLEYLRENAAKITYTVNNTIIEGEKATVSVDFKYVNGSPLIKSTIEEIFTKAMSMAFSGEEVSDEEMREMFVSAMKDQQQSIEESFVEKSIDIKLVQVDKKWYIDESSDELLDVFTSNFISVGNELEEAMNPSDDDSEDLTFMEQAKKDNMTIITKAIGDEITLTTIKLKINEMEEKQTITREYGSSVTAKEGTKFVVVNADITNITDKAFSMSPNLLIADSEERLFKAADAILILDDYLDYRELSPNIKETGSWLYELPQDSASLSLVTQKSGTNELYIINLK